MVKTTVEVEITQEDIEKATPFSNCPATIAVSRALGKRIGINNGALWLANRVIGHIPAEVMKALRDFDFGGGMYPLKFEVTV